MFLHDTPVNTTKYYGMEDLLYYLAKSPPTFLQQNLVKIALCFKIDDFSLCDNSKKAKNCFGLIDDFYTNINKIIQQNQLQLEIILDGAASDLSCAPQRYRPWVMTWFGNASSPVMFSNDQNLGYDRLAVLDPEVILDPLIFLCVLIQIDQILVAILGSGF